MDEQSLPCLDILEATPEILGASDRLGRIEAGYNADLILVRGNPLQDLSTLRAPKWVLRDGKTVVHP